MQEEEAKDSEEWNQNLDKLQAKLAACIEFERDYQIENHDQIEKIKEAIEITYPKIT